MVVTVVFSERGSARAVLRFLGLAFGAFLDAHILEFARLEDLAALEALHEFGVFFAADDLHARMFTRLFAHVLGMRERL
jgi:hypothetical protein